MRAAIIRFPGSTCDQDCHHVLRESGFTELLEEAQADAVIFGHLHGYKPSRLPKEWKGIPLHFVACDAVNFVPQIVLEQV